jgi:hypothetical protein
MALMVVCKASRSYFRWVIQRSYITLVSTCERDLNAFALGVAAVPVHSFAERGARKGTRVAEIICPAR